MKTVRDVYFFGREDGMIWVDVGPTPDDAVLVDPNDCGFCIDNKNKTLKITNYKTNVAYCSAKGHPEIQ